MLKRFEVSGYRKFKDKFILDLSDTRDYQFNKQCIKNGILNSAIIYGKNSVGKTSFGRALTDIRDTVLGSPFLAGEEDFLNADLEVGYADFNYFFEFDDTSINYSYKKKNSEILARERLVINEKVIFDFNHETGEKIEDNLSEINADTLNWEFKDENICILRYIVNNTLQPNTSVIRSLYSFIAGMRFIRGNSEMRFPKMYNSIISNIIEKNMIEEFESFLNDSGVKCKLVVKTTSSGEEALFFDHKKPIPFISNMSSGTAALLMFFNWYKKIDMVSFLYLDEFDAFYHFELSERIVRLLEEIDNCQTIATSHNTNLLSNKIMRPDCFFVLTNEKIISIVNATERELREGHNLEKLYKSGEFGE